MQDQLPSTTIVPELGMSLPLDSILMIVFLLLVAGFIIYGVILHFHWRQYSASKQASFWTYVAFIGSTVPLLAIMGLIALSY